MIQFSKETDYTLKKEKKVNFKKTLTNDDLTLKEKGNTIQAKERYHDQGLKQAKIGFWFGIVGASIGLIVIIVALCFLEDKLWGSISGIVIECVSLLIFRISDNAIARMGDFFDILGKDNDKIRAIDLTNSIKDDKTKAELSVKLALHLAGINEDKICKKTKEVCTVSEIDS